MKEEKTLGDKHIWIFNHYAITPDYPGGTRHFELGKNLSMKGNKVVIFGSSFIHMKLGSILLGKREKYKIEKFDNLVFIWVKTWGYKKNNWRRLLNMLHYCWSAYRISKRLVKNKVLKKPDVIIGSTVHPFTPLMASILAKEYQVPFLFEIRDLWPQTFIDMGIWKDRQIKARLFKWIEKHAVNMSQGIVVLSPLTIVYLKKRYSIKNDRLIYIPNGVNLDLYHKDSGSPNRDQLDTREIRLVYLGGVEVVHNLDGLFYAMEFLEKENSPITLYIYGSGKHKDFLKRKFPLSNVKWMGAVKKCEVPGILSSADLLYMSTGEVYYGSENKLFEYLASEKPVISNVFSRHNDIVEKINAGVSVRPGDREALIHTLKRIAALSPEERKNMGKQGRLYVEKNHRWEFLAELFENFLKKVNHEVIH